MRHIIELPATYQLWMLYHIYLLDEHPARSPCLNRWLCGIYFITFYACLLVSRSCFMTYTSHRNNEDQMKPCNVDSDWKTNYPLTGLHICVAGPAYCSCMPLYGQNMGFILTLRTKHSHKWPPRTFASPQDTVWNGHRVELQHMCNLQW